MANGDISFDTHWALQFKLLLLIWIIFHVLAKSITDFYDWNLFIILMVVIISYRGICLLLRRAIEVMIAIL